VSPATGPLRGQVFHVDIPGIGPHYWLVVSNNIRNAAFSDVLTVMLTTTPPRSPRPSYVPLDRSRDGFEGWVKCDDLGPIFKSDLGRVSGALSAQTLRAIDAGLGHALGIPG
jgi:mRNA interferase MazF